ncbi:MAG: restriction endonuclease [Planctomycetia bacterium]|nr:restriction endonuclease [Planctomycetia bacterium]
MKPKLTIECLIEEAVIFGSMMSQENHVSLFGVSDGKAVGTYVEHRFQEYLSERYIMLIGSSAKGIDLPDSEILTDIKVTSYIQPQSSCPFENARQKVFGLGYNLLVFVYQKQDIDNRCNLHFKYCTFIEKHLTGDYTLTKRLREMLDDGANRDDIISLLHDRCIPGDEIVLNELAEEILQNKPEQGYLTISNAFQWRLSYTRAIKLNNCIVGIKNYEW